MKIEIKYQYLIYVGLIVAFLLRAFNLNYQGLWNDELYTAVTSHPRLSIGEVIDFLKRDIHPPLHNILTNLWTKTFSYSDTSLRMFNIVLGVFGTLSIYHLAKELFNKKVAIYAFIFSIVNYYLIFYSQEVRAYGMLCLLANYSFLFFVRLIRSDFSFKDAIWYVLATTAMLYTHYFSLFVVAGQFFAFFIFMNWNRFRTKIWHYLVTFALPNLIFYFGCLIFLII
jgi:mannosyltransferase